MASELAYTRLLTVASTTITALALALGSYTAEAVKTTAISVAAQSQSVTVKTLLNKGLLSNLKAAFPGGVAKKFFQKKSSKKH